MFGDPSGRNIRRGCPEREKRQRGSTNCDSSEEHLELRKVFWGISEGGCGK